MVGLAALAVSVIGKPAQAGAPLGPEVRQLLVSIAPDWDASQGKMIGLERDGRGGWKTTFKPVPVLFGRNGLAWGRGVLGTGEPGRAKVERDGRAPAGVFRIGKIYTHDPTLPKGADYPYHTITKADAWIDDPNLPQYNRHVVVDPENPPAWFEKEKMRHNDFAYRWLVEIRHNADPPVANMGSAIFFHIRRGKTRPTAGCTTMEEATLANMIRWLDAGRNPHYALLTWAEYQKKWKAWGLPSPETIRAIAP
ncbi:MAG TPA: L,D-transpeptidase family protein [Chthoniobacteraceae bacterium]|nr:L,D-transpeptidase family protein [Chthoniobacteraceae bacterium]